MFKADIQALFTQLRNTVSPFDSASLGVLPCLPIALCIRLCLPFRAEGQLSWKFAIIKYEYCHWRVKLLEVGIEQKQRSGELLFLLLWNHQQLNTISVLCIPRVAAFSTNDSVWYHFCVLRRVPEVE